VNRSPELFLCGKSYCRQKRFRCASLVLWNASLWYTYYNWDYYRVIAGWGFSTNYTRGTFMIIFDLDGTLWDSSVQVADSWNIVIEKEVGREHTLTSEDIMRYMGMTMTEIADRHFGYLPEEQRYDLSHKCEVFENDYITEHGGVLFEGVEETLKKLKDRGVKMAVVSNCQEGYVKAFLDSMDMWKYFDDYEEWGRTMLLKADNIKLVMERNNEPKSIYVGDIQKDSDASHKAGVDCIWAAYGFGEINDAVAKIDSFDELPAVLEELGYI